MTNIKIALELGAKKLKNSSPTPMLDAEILLCLVLNKNRLDLQTKIKKTSKEQYQPWFSFKHKSLKELDNIVFGHWAALNGVTNHNKIKGIDLGCVWGGSLAAINVHDKSIITVNSVK